MTAPRFLSVCSGIEAASIAWNPLGWQCVGVAEIDPFACKLLNHRHGASRPLFMPSPDALIAPPVTVRDSIKDPVGVVQRALTIARDRKARAAAIKAVARLPETASLPNFGDLEQFRKWPDAIFDVLVGGTPCQAFSIAGFRAGLADPRGNLALVYLAILDRYRPEWFLWENVPGVLSSNGGRDFGAFLAGVAKLGYGFAYRVLDAQYVRTRGLPFAVPQRRRRVFLVGRLADWRGPAAVLFDGESLRGNPAPIRRARQSPSRAFTTSLGVGSLTDVAATLDAGAKDGPVRNQMGTGLIIPHAPAVSGALAARDEKAPRPEDDVGIIAEERTILSLDVAHSLRAEGFDASEDGSGRGTPIVPVVASTLRGQPNDARAADLQTYIPFDLAQITSPTNQTRAEPGSPAGTLAAGSQPHVAYQEPIAFSAKDYGADAIEGLSPTIRAGGHNKSHANGGVMPAIAYRIGADGDFWQEGDATAPLTTMTDRNQNVVAHPTVDVAPTVRAGGNSTGGDRPYGTDVDTADSLLAVEPITIAARGRDGEQNIETRQDGSANSILGTTGGRSGFGSGAIAIPWAVRRLTPLECERLQGFPDHYTALPHKGAGDPPDGPRYKAIGNSMAVNAMQFLGERIDLIRALIAEQEARD